MAHSKVTIRGIGEHEHPAVWHQHHDNPMPVKTVLFSFAKNTPIGREIVARLEAFGFESASIVGLSGVLTLSQEYT